MREYGGKPPVQNDVEAEEKVRNARGVGFYPFVLRRSATKETVGKSNLGFTPSLRSFARSSRF